MQGLYALLLLLNLFEKECSQMCASMQRAASKKERPVTMDVFVQLVTDDCLVYDDATRQRSSSFSYGLKRCVVGV